MLSSPKLGPSCPLWGFRSMFRSVTCSVHMRCEIIRPHCLSLNDDRVAESLTLLLKVTWRFLNYFILVNRFLKPSTCQRSFFRTLEDKSINEPRVVTLLRCSAHLLWTLQSVFSIIKNCEVEYLFFHQTRSAKEKDRVLYRCYLHCTVDYIKPTTVDFLQMISLWSKFWACSSKDGTLPVVSHRSGSSWWEVGQCPRLRGQRYFFLPGYPSSLLTLQTISIQCMLVTMCTNWCPHQELIKAWMTSKPYCGHQLVHIVTSIHFLPPLSPVSSAPLSHTGFIWDSFFYT